ncbi:MAG: hypothetical protein ACUZ8O_11110 [Candidatus Anammoxibacter sp.]
MHTRLLFCFLFCLILSLSDKAHSREEQKSVYLGAPAIIPHGVGSEGRTACLHCHENGLIVDKIKTPLTPHSPELINCRQCHLHLKNIPLFKQNSFIGLKSPEKTFRQNPYSPPLIPHRTFMLRKCLNCHGNEAFSEKYTQTGHPDRQNCKQCHIAPIDNSIFLTLE